MSEKRMYRFSKTKHPTYKVKCDLKHLKTGRQIKGWKIYETRRGECVSPDPFELTVDGWAQVICCFLFCFPCTCAPCCLSDNYDGYQIPIFEEYHPPVIPSAPELPIAIPIATKVNVNHQEF